MSTPVSYSAASLALYLHGVLGPLADVLGWAPATEPDGPGSYAEIITDALLDAGWHDLDGADDVRKLRALSRRALWRAAVEALASHVDLTTPEGLSVRESGLQAQALAALARAEAAAAAYDDLSAPVAYVDVYRSEHAQ